MNCKRFQTFILFRVRAFQWNEFVIPTSLNIRLYLNELVEPVELKENRERVELGLQEALVNAVVHGNSNAQDKCIRIRRIITPNWLVWQIQDQGDGVKLSQRNYSLPLEVEAESGRGLFLIHECFDDVRWSNKGNRLQIACRR